MRKPGSIVRDRVFDIINELNETYAWEIAKVYSEKYGYKPLKNIYYHLKELEKKGEIERIQKEYEQEPGKPPRVYYRIKHESDENENNFDNIGWIGGQTNP